MKINQSSPSTVPFSSLKVGNIFEHNGNIYMKTPEITTTEYDMGVCYNAYNLTNNSYVSFGVIFQVLPYPNATLNLIP